MVSRVRRPSAEDVGAPAELSRRRDRIARQEAQDYRAARAIVWARCRGWCDLCGTAFRVIDRMSAHHRLARSHGRNDNPSNLLALCAGCHQDVHRNPAHSRAQGWIISGHERRAPADVLAHTRMGWVRLLPDGSVLPAASRVT